MKCVGCGAELAADAAFCAKCGRPVNADASEAPSGLPPGKARLQDAAQRAADNNDVEEKMWEGGYSGKAMIGTWIGCVALSIAMIAIAIFFPPAAIVTLSVMFIAWVFAFTYYAYRRIGMSYKLTSQRFIHSSGLLRRVTDRIEVIDIDDVTAAQGVVERAFGVGTICIESSDRTHPRLVLPGIDDVHRVAGMIDDVRRKERRKRGIHIEQV